MNLMQKTTTLVIALSITLLGATLATAPLALAGRRSVGGAPSTMSAPAAVPAIRKYV